MIAAVVGGGPDGSPLLSAYPDTMLKVNWLTLPTVIHPNQRSSALQYRRTTHRSPVAQRARL
ncbi:hypothetical protein ACQP2U_32540 [Nocardia sp. CA-084685]|uniref:hypothetical protein n=1 Tax=Nocardia sp. CA-084685 TaxID=3239970 RepID=UPI003D95B06A